MLHTSWVKDLYVYIADVQQRTIWIYNYYLFCDRVNTFKFLDPFSWFLFIFGKLFSNIRANISPSFLHKILWLRSDPHHLKVLYRRAIQSSSSLLAAVACLDFLCQSVSVGLTQEIQTHNGSEETSHPVVSLQPSHVCISCVNQLVLDWYRKFKYVMAARRLVIQFINSNLKSLKP